LCCQNYTKFADGEHRQAADDEQVCIIFLICRSFGKQIHVSGQVGQLSQANRAAACISFGKNISAKTMHLISLYPTAYDYLTVLRHYVCTYCKIMQHLGVNFEGIWRFELGFFVLVFWCACLKIWADF